MPNNASRIRFTHRALLIALLVSNHSGVLASQCTSNDSGGPCFAENDDILGGERAFLPDDDLQVTVRRDHDSDNDIMFYDLKTKDIAVSSDSSSSSSVSCSPNPQVLTQSLVGRVFSLSNDVIVNYRPKSDCSKLLLHVTDPVDSANDSTAGFDLGSPDVSKLGYTGMAMADFNLDGYQDIIFVNDISAQLYYALCTNDPFSTCTEPVSAGVDIGLRYSPSTTGPYASPPVTGDFNGDGVYDAAWPAYTNKGEIVVELVSVCPAQGVVIDGHSCSQWTEIISLGSIDLGADVDLTGKNTPRPYVALAMGNFDGSVNTTTGIANDELLVVITDSSNSKATVTAYQFDPGSNSLRKKTTLEFTDLKRDENNTLQVFLAAAQLDSSTLQSQAVFSATKDSSSKDHRGFVSAITFDSSLNMTPHTTVLGNNDKTRIFGMAVGRFDPPENNGDTDFDQQFAVLVDHDADDTLIQLYTAKKADSFTPKQADQYQLTSERLYNNEFMQLAALQAGDLQGRSLLLGAPEKVTISQIQPDVILGLPPMHVDFIEQLGGGTPEVLNVSVFPGTFNVGFEFDDTTGTQGSHQGTTSYAGSYKESVGITVKYGVPDADSVTAKFKASATQNHQRSVTTTYNSYKGQSYSFATQTQFDDLVAATAKQLNVYTYPVIGQTACPVESPNCPSDCSPGPSPCPKQPLMVQYSAPDNITYAPPTDGGSLEWYQPVTEPGNLFSYPGSLTLLEQTEPQQTDPNTGVTSSAIHLLTSDSSVWDSQSTGKVNIQWSAGAGASKSVSITDAFSFDIGVSVKFKESDLVSSGSQKFAFDTNQSLSLGTLNTSTQQFTASTGVILNRGLGPDGPGSSEEFLYEGQSYIYGLQQPIGAIQSDITTPTENVSSQGPFKVAHVADMLSTGLIQSGDWWKTAYTSAPDLALNHPQRWLQKLPTSQNTQQVMFNCPVGFEAAFGTPSSDPGSCVANYDQPTPQKISESAFYKMKGLFVTPDTETGPATTIATLGDVLTVQARVYNYSLANMPQGTSIHAAFYAQPWDSSQGTFASGNTEYKFANAVFIGEDVFMDPIPAFCGGSDNIDSCTDQNAPLNWVLAKAQWDTSLLSPVPVTNTNWSLWVVVWMEDDNGELLTEIKEHGLNSIPGTDLGSLAEVDIETYSNNLGFYNQVFTLELPNAAATAVAPVGPNVGERHLSIEQMEVDTAKLAADRQSIVRVHYQANNGRYDRIVALLYEGDPEDGGQLLDMDIVPTIDADTRFVVPFVYRPRNCGWHTLYAQTYQNDGLDPVVGKVTVKVPCAPLGVSKLRGMARGAGKHKGKPSGAVRIKGQLRLTRELDLSSPSTTVTLEALLSETLGAGELVDGIPLELVPGHHNNRRAATFVTEKGSAPKAVLQIVAGRQTGSYSFRLSVEHASIEGAELCPSPDLKTQLSIYDDDPVPALLTTELKWYCAGKSGNLHTR